MLVTNQRKINTLSEVLADSSVTFPPDMTIQTKNSATIVDQPTVDRTERSTEL